MGPALPILPEAFRRLGMSLRAEAPEDAPFLLALFESVRGPEFAAQGWPEETRRAFLADQFRLQVAHYKTAFREALFLIVLREQEPIGRLYLYYGARDHRIVDVSLLPAARNQGIGGALLDMVCAQAAARGCCTSIHVEQNNPAQRLYARKGFRPAGEHGPYRLMIRPAQAREQAGREAVTSPS